MTRAPAVTAIVAGIPTTVPFVGPEAQERERGALFRARLGANENGFGPSPRAIAAMQAAAADNWMYADPTNFDLIAAIAQLHGVAAQNVVVGEGIDGLLGLTVHLLVGSGAVVVTSDGAYPTFNFHVANHGGRLVKVPYVADREDIDGLLAAAHRERAVIVYVSNPDNPMGSWWGAADIARLIAGLPPGCLLCLDEAYIDTLPMSERPVVDVAHPQVLRFRTMSKAYGLAGARIGYALGAAPLIAAFEKVRNHYGINRVGQIGALAAIEDQAYLAEVVAKIARSRDRIGEIVRDCGLVALPSAASFVAVDCGRDAAFAQRVLDGLLARGVFVRKPGAAPLSRCIRISAGPDVALAILADALPDAVRDAG